MVMRNLGIMKIACFHKSSILLKCFVVGSLLLYSFKGYSCTHDSFIFVVVK